MPSRKEETYLFQHQRLVLCDPELSLSVDEAFEPTLLPEKPMWGQELADGSFVAGNVAGTEFLVEKHGRPHGQCLLFYASKALKGEQFYVEGKLHGPSSFFSAHGQVLSLAWYLHGRQVGKCHWYYPDGRLYSMQRFKDGLPHGKQEYFLPDGQIKTVLVCEMGVIQQALL